MAQPQTQQHIGSRAILRRYTALVALIGLGVVVLLILLTTVLFRDTAQTGIISNLILICFGLCPLLLCGLILYAVLLVAVFGVNSVTTFGERNLSKVRQRTRQIAERTGKAGNDLSRRSIGIGTKLSSLNVVFDNDEDSPESDETL